MVTAEPWSGITTAAAEARAIPGMPLTSRAGARNPRCGHLWATDSSTASPPTNPSLRPEEPAAIRLSRDQASALLFLLPEGGMNNLKRRLFHNEEGAIGYILAWFMGVPAIVLFAIFLLRGCN